MSIVPDYKYLEHEEFFSQNLTGEKIFIFGSSPIYAINPVNVSNHLLEKGHSYTVYNLGQGSSDAEEQLRTVDFVISQEPKIVIYGIAYHTFYSHGRTIVEKPPESLAAPPKLSDLLSTISLPFNTGLLDNPKFATINTFNHFYKKQTGNFQEEPERPYPNTPFMVYSPHTGIPAEQKDLEKGGKFANYKGNDHNIEVIIFTTPHLKTWLEQVPTQQKEIFNSMLDDLEKEFNFEVFRLHDKYEVMDIWVDQFHHISHSEKTDFYSEEIAKMILTGIDE